MTKCTAKTKNLIALCHILDKFEKFNKRLKEVITTKYNRDFVENLRKISNGKFCLCSRQTKIFYSENKTIIDIINTYSNISMFINANYDWYGNPLNNNSLELFYEYLSNHKEKLTEIIALLNKIETLGFEELEFDSNIDFTKEHYQMNTSLGENWEIEYLDNLEVIPGYNPSTIEYKTNNSNYKMTINHLYGGKKDGIVLNDLTFDPDRLPNTISKEETFDKIVELKLQHQQDYNAIKDSVDLGIGIADLYLMHKKLSNKIVNLTNVEKKEELMKLLLVIEDTILQMQEISQEYDRNVTSSNTGISENLLETEKKAYIKRRKESSLHIC